MEEDQKKQIGQYMDFMDIQKDKNQKMINKNKKVSDHLQEYEEFRKNIMKEKHYETNEKYADCFYFNYINELPLQVYSKVILLKQYKNLQSNGIKIKQKFQKQIKIQINETSQHGQIMQIVVTFGYLQFNLNVLNFVQKSQKFIQPIVQIGMGTYGCIYSYIYDKKKYAIKKIKIKHFNKGSDSIIYQTKSPLFQYCIYKLLSAVKLGLKLSQDVFGFDLLCFQDVICFSMQIGVQPRFQPSQKGSEDCKKFIQLQQTLLFLHDFHIIHSDIKPQNILYSTEHDRIVFIDFGISDCIQQCQGEMTFSCFKGTFEYCNEQMKRLILFDQPQLIDRYWSDLCSLKISIKQAIKNYALTKNFIYWSEYQSISYNFDQNDDFKELKQKTIFRNFFLQAKLIHLIYQENQEQIKLFLQKQKQKVDIVNILSIFLQLNPTILLSRIYKIFFRKKNQNNSLFNQKQRQIDQIFQSHSLKTVINYDAKKGQFFKKKYKQINFMNRQNQQLTIRKKLQESIHQFNPQNETLCYFQFLGWLERINFFIINQKIIEKQEIYEIIRIFGRKLFDNQSDFLTIDVLLSKCLKKIKQDTQILVKSFFKEKKSNKDYEITEKQKIQNQLNIQILFKLSTVFYRIFEFKLSQELLLSYLNFTSNISKFFYSIFQMIKMVFLTADTYSPHIYMAYFKAIYPNNLDVVKQKKYQSVQKYLKYFPEENQISITSKTLIQLKQKVALFWEKANIRERNLFEIYLQLIRIIFIPIKIAVSEFQKLQNQKLRLLDKNLKELIMTLQSKQVEIQEFYLKKLIIDMYQQFANINFYLNFQKRIALYYKLLEKKNEKYISDMMNQLILIKLSQCLLSMKLPLDQIKDLIKNVREQNIFGTKIIGTDLCISFKAFNLRCNPQTFQQGQRLFIFLLQKTIKQGYKNMKSGEKYLNALIIHKIFQFFDDIITNQVKQNYYWKIKQFFIVYQTDDQRFYKNMIQLLNLLPIQVYLKQVFAQQLQLALKKVQEIDGFRQKADSYWVLKAQSAGLKNGNKKRLQVYRQSHKFSANFFSFNHVRKYIEAIQIEFQNNQKIPHIKIKNEKIEQEEQKYRKQIFQAIDCMEKYGKQHFFLIPSSVSFQCFLLETFFKTKPYSFIINYFVKFAQFIKQLTQVHNKIHLKFYKSIVVNFLDSNFFKQKDVEFNRLALTLLINSSIEQISKYFPQILFFYSAMLARNRKYAMTNLQYRSIIKILKLIQYAQKTTQKEIQQYFYMLMIGVTEEWQIAKRHKTKIKNTRKFYYLKCVRHTHFSSFYNFEQKYMSKTQSKFRQKLIKKIKTLKKIWK